MAETNNQSLPESYICPLTHEVMSDPVVDPEGNSYERSAIEEWLEKNKTSPITRSPLTIKDLIPNRALQTAIEEKCKELGIEIKKPKPTSHNNNNNSSKKEDKAENQPQDADSVSIRAVGTKVSDGTEREVLVSVKPPQGTVRTPTDICCVVDVSGSMGSEATLKTATGGVEGHGLSVLDIVKHAVNTIISALLPEDRLSIVTYSDNAKVVFTMSNMSDAAKSDALKVVEKLHPMDSTNIWAGLETGLDILRKNATAGRLTSLLLLTDGMPNISPPRGEVFMLKKYIDQHQHLSTTINTFGFGYSINSQLLREIAIEGNGMYAFIPDSSFVGTAFVNCLSNLLVTMAKNVYLLLEPSNGAQLLESGGVLGNHLFQKTSWGGQVKLCSLQYGQSKDIVVRLSVPGTLGANTPYLTATVKYELKTGSEPIQHSVDVVDQEISGESAVDVAANRYRLLFVERVKQAMDNADRGDSAKSIKAFIGEIRAESPAILADNRVKTLLEDLEGQVLSALERADYFKKWGTHYLPSLMRAHQLQQCNNFKDPGIQNYGGKLFQSIRDVIDDIFVKLPAPKPSIKKYSYSGSTATVQPSKPVSMRAYHSSANPCFSGESQVLMADNSLRSVKLVKKGDSIKTVDNKTAKVLCVVQTFCQNGMADLVQLEGGLLVTPWHPVRINGKWNFPADLAEPSNMPCSAVYSFVLETDHIMIINGIECVTLGHDFKEDVVSHSYFGSQRVIEDLKKIRGWSVGLIQFNSGCLIRDSASDLVVGFQQSAIVV